MVIKDSFIYKSGDIWLPKNIVQFLHTYVVGNDSTLFYINYWHGMHFLSGILFGYFFSFFPLQHPLYAYLLLHTLWEIWQLWIGMTRPNLRGIIDILVDTFMGLAGLRFIIFLVNKFDPYLHTK